MDNNIPKASPKVISMDLFGDFHKVEIDGKPHLVYHNFLKPQIPSSNSSDEETTIEKPLSIQHKKTSDKVAIESSNDLPLPPLFICPSVRYQLQARIDNITLLDEDGERIRDLFYKLKTSPLLGGNMSYGHDLFPLFWCNNKEVDPEDIDCAICRVQKVGTDYYFCVRCDARYHKECVESPIEINYPSHVKHSLQLYYSWKDSDCILCTRRAYNVLYYCALCDIYMHMPCAQVAIPFFIDQPKRHDHTLTLFPRQASLTCNVCGLVNKLHLTYVCRSICDYVAHNDCIHIPQTVRISRHHHRVSFISSLPSGKWCCGVCRHDVDRDYGAYTCNVCSGYAVHTKCALRKDVWDGKELEGVPEEEEDVEPFERIADGIILHFSHDCHLKFQSNGVYNKDKFCQACTLPVNEENYYICVECDFILHRRCADAPRKKVHPLHPHPLELKATHVERFFICYACNRVSNGFVYECATEDCDNMDIPCILDMVCASVSEPFNYQGHQHPLFLALDPKEKPKCHICKSVGINKVLNCVECDFIICFKCVTLPYMVRYKHDEHYLTFCRGDEVSEADWCELCEGKLAVGGKEGFYKCNDCCTTLHINCLLGPDPYLKPGLLLSVDDGTRELFSLRNNSASRPICGECNIRCLYPIYLRFRNGIFYSFRCAGSSH